MKTIFWKEWREHGRWAILGMAALALAQGYALWQLVYGQNNSFPRHDYESICSDLFLTVTTFGYAAAGLILALLQTLPERAPDRWAFLVHRPLSATGLFFGKALAGISLYLAAAVPPLLGAAWWASVPGHFTGPFVPGMMVPGACDLLAGIVWYLAGLLVGLRQARWYGTRLLPLAAAWFVTVCVTRCWMVSYALGYACWIGLVLAVAAWGAFCGQGEDRAQPRRGRVALFVALALGGYALLFYGGEFGYAPLFTPNQRDAVWYDYQATHDGQIVIAVRPQMGESYVTDLAGRTLSSPPYDTGFHRSKALALNNGLGNGNPPGPEPHYGPYRQFEHYAVANNSVWDGHLSGFWFYLPGERRFVEYGIEERRLVARLGADGLKRADEPCAPFPEPLTEFGTHHFLFSHAAYAFDERSGKAVRLASPDPGAPPLHAVTGLPRASDREGALPTVYAVADGEGISFHGADGTFLVRVRHLHDPKVYRTVMAAKPEGPGYFLWYRKSNQSYFDRLDDAGNLVQEIELPPLVNKVNPRFWWWDANQYFRPFLTVAWDRGNRFFQARFGTDPKRWQKGWVEHTLKEPGKELQYLGRSIRWGAGGALFALAWGAVLGLPWRRTLPGALGLLAFGPGALPAFFALCPWPGYQPCPTCGHRRRHDAATCPHL